MATDLAKLPDAEFSAELDRRLEELDAAWKAVVGQFDSSFSSSGGVGQRS